MKYEDTIVYLENTYRPGKQEGGQSERRGGGRRTTQRLAQSTGPDGVVGAHPLSWHSVDTRSDTRVGPPAQIQEWAQTTDRRKARC